MARAMVRGPEPDGGRRPKRRRLLADAAGATMVEMALVLPLFVLLTIGMIEVGRAIWTQTTLERGAQAATRFAIVRGSSSDAPASANDIRAFAREQMIGVPATAAIDVSWNPSNAPGGEVTVEVTLPFQLLFSPVPLGPITLTGASTMVVSR